VSVRIVRQDGVLRAEGEITDEHEAPVSHRVIEHPGKTDGKDCIALAKAAGVWASLVLDEEVERAKAVPKPAPPIESPMTMWPAPSPPEKPSPEAHLFLHHGDDERSFEVGVGSFLMAGTGAGVIAGLSLFSIAETGNGWFLQPGVSIGRTVQELQQTSDVYATWGAGRFDACKRLPGNYLERRGIQLHFDAPSDTPIAQGYKQSTGRTIPVFDVGPSFALRGELGGDLSVIVRGMLGLNVVRESFIDQTGTNAQPGWLVGRGEIALTWRLR
jgi:hypothetical protein